MKSQSTQILTDYRGEDRQATADEELPGGELATGTGELQLDFPTNSTGCYN